MALPLPPVEPVSHLDIDDFALRRGRTYGTVLVDLTRYQVIDLLPDRKAQTAKAWMQAHSEIELVSRDRGGDYATAARAPCIVGTNKNRDQHGHMKRLISLRECNCIDSRTRSSHSPTKALKI